MSKKRSDVYFPFGPLLLYLFILQFRWFAFINIMIQVWQRRVLTYIRLEQRGYMRLVYAQVLLVILFFNMIYLIFTFNIRFGINIFNRMLSFDVPSFADQKTPYEERYTKLLEHTDSEHPFNVFPCFSFPVLLSSIFCLFANFLVLVYCVASSLHFWSSKLVRAVCDRLRRRGDNTTEMWIIL